MFYNIIEGNYDDSALQVTVSFPCPCHIVGCWDIDGKPITLLKAADAFQRQTAISLGHRGVTNGVTGTQNLDASQFSTNNGGPCTIAIMYGED